MPDPASAADREDEALDPAQAALLLEQTRQRTHRALDFRSPRLSLIAAGVVLVGFGVVWLSVRGQHPYTGPTAASLVVLYALVLIRLGTVAHRAAHATAGVSGRSVRAWRSEAGAAAAALIAVYVLMGALTHAGVSHPVAYWLYGFTATLLVLGAVWSGRSAAVEDWPQLAISIAIMLVAAFSAFAGPRGMWLGDAIGGSVVLLAGSAAQAWKLHALPAGKA